MSDPFNPMLYTKHTSSEGIQLWMVTQMIIKYLKLINYWGIEIIVISIFYLNVVQLFVKQFAQITILYTHHQKWRNPIMNGDTNNK